MTVSGLTRCQRHLARDRTVQAAMLGLRHASSIHYTQGSRRWDGIDDKNVSAVGEYPHYADCSAFATWCLWNGLHVPFKWDDVVNGLGWDAGFTGTMLNHGREIHHLRNVVRGDCVLYGTHDVPHHTAIVVGRKQGIPIVVSHGSEAGPLLLRFDYRPDIGQIRRYI